MTISPLQAELEAIAAAEHNLAGPEPEPVLNAREFIQGTEPWIRQCHSIIQEWTGQAEAASETYNLARWQLFVRQLNDQDLGWCSRDRHYPASGHPVPIHQLRVVHLQYSYVTSGYYNYLRDARDAFVLCLEHAVQLHDWNKDDGEQGRYTVETQPAANWPEFYQANMVDLPAIAERYGIPPKR